MSRKSRGWVPRRLAVGKIVVGVALTVVVAGATTVASARPRLAELVFDEQRIEFAPGTDNATRAGNVDPVNSDRWILRANAGQVMDLTVDAADDNTVFSVFAPGHNLMANVSEGRSWSGMLPAAGDYAIEVASLDGAAYYQLKVWIDATVRDPLGLVQRMSFAPGTDSGTAGGAVVRASADTWVLGAAAGQRMDVSVVSIEANSTFDVLAPNGSRLTASDERTVWTGQLPHDGDYQVVVQPTFGNATYTITVRITGGETSSPPRPQQPTQPTTRRISFPPGTDNLTISDDIGPGESHRWLAGAAAGQTMELFLGSGGSDMWIDVTDPDGLQLTTAQHELVVGLTTDGDHAITVTNLSDVAGTYVLIVVIT